MVFVIPRKSAPFAEFRVSCNGPFRGSKRNIPVGIPRKNEVCRNKKTVEVGNTGLINTFKVSIKS